MHAALGNRTVSAKIVLSSLIEASPSMVPSVHPELELELEPRPAQRSAPPAATAGYQRGRGVDLVVEFAGLHAGGECEPLGRREHQVATVRVLRVPDGTATVRQVGDFNAGSIATAAARLAPLNMG
jgi:hypothetical protein